MENFMENLPGAGRAEAYKKLEKLCFLRQNSNLTEEQRAQEAGWGSAKAMNIQLKNCGLPGLVGEEDPARGGESKKRKAQKSGQEEKLPYASEAQDLFYNDLARLFLFVEQLPLLDEYFEAGRFTSISSFSNDYSGGHEKSLQRLCNAIKEIDLPKPRISEEEYKKIEKWDEKLGGGLLRGDYQQFTSTFYTHGGKKTPNEGLVCLIALYTLLNESVDPLVERLHSKPIEVDQGKLYEEKHGYVTELKSIAGKLAITVRGQEVPVAKGPGELSPEEMWVTLNLIMPFAEGGWSDKEIYQKFKDNLLDEDDKFGGEKYTVKDIQRLRRILLKTPENSTPFYQ
jgi:hypothetical protein